MRLLIALIISALLLSLLGTFLWVDQRVGERLASRQTAGLSFVLSGPSQIRSGSPAATLIKSRLEARKYAQTNEVTVPPGEYSAKDNTLIVTTRPYRDAMGTLIPASSVQVDLNSGEMTSLTGEPISSLTLEPIPIAPLGSSEVRASSFRSLAQIPRPLQDAFLAIEDRRFYNHLGVDPIAISRAMVKNVAAGRLVEGGSTLTQQLAKNILFTAKKTFGRKFMEMFAALSLERRLTKQRILEMYLNEIYFSQEGQVAVHGVQEAAQSFFAKDVDKLTIAEGALLAGLVRAPTSYSPRRNIKRATERRDLVLSEMKAQGFITDQQYTAAVAEKITLGPAPFRKKNAPYFVATIEKNFGESFDIESAAVSGVQVHTWLDPDLQNCAEQAVRESIEALEKTHPTLRKKHQGRMFQQSLVVIEPFSGAIKAWVGGRDFSTNQFDHVFMARRQIGSTIKPFLYLTALDGTLNSYRVATPISILSDEPTGITLFNHSQWKPKNYDRKFRGDVTLRFALERSLNVPAVYVAQRVGIHALAETLRHFDVSPDIPEVPALALGALDTTLLRLTSAYGALANGGRYVAPRIYSSVLDSDGHELTSTVHSESPVAQDGPVYLVTDILRGVIERGTAQVIRRMGYTGVVAGKTGTSNDSRDAWFVGFTPRLSVGVWTGFDDNSPLGLTGGVASAPTWARFMKCASPLIEHEEFIRPPSVELVSLDKELFCRASPEYPRDRVVNELFVRGTAPTEECEAHRQPEDESEYQGEIDGARPEDETPGEHGQEGMHDGSNPSRGDQEHSGRIVTRSPRDTESDYPNHDSADSGDHDEEADWYLQDNQDSSHPNNSRDERARDRRPAPHERDYSDESEYSDDGYGYEYPEGDWR